MWIDLERVTLRDEKSSQIVRVAGVYLKSILEILIL